LQQDGFIPNVLTRYIEVVGVRHCVVMDMTVNVLPTVEFLGVDRGVAKPESPFLHNPMHFYPFHTTELSKTSVFVIPKADVYALEGRCVSLYSPELILLKTNIPKNPKGVVLTTTVHNVVVDGLVMFFIRRELSTKLITNTIMAEVCV
tara:strand:+ start:15737 stop:16180 length:444 start_codon:yes stop_codon:yes gene_type:complete